MPLLEQAPTVRAWLRRPMGEAAIAAYLALVAAAVVAWLAVHDAGHPGAAALLVTGLQVALVLASAALVLHLASVRRLSVPASLVASTSALLTWLMADDLYRLVFYEDLNFQALALLGEALRSHAVKFQFGLFRDMTLAVVLMAAVARALAGALSYLPAARSPRPAPRLALLAVAVLLALVDPGRTGAAHLRRPLPWSPAADAYQTPERRAAGDSPSPFGDAAEERMARRLASDREALLAGPLSAKRRPSIVFMHLESTRFDMLRPDVMPNTLRLTQSCLTTPLHYSTSNNTGSSMFGLLTGLPVSYYGLARRAGMQPLPLQILKKLGYTLSAYYTNYLATYDGLCDLFFRGLVDRVHEQDLDAQEADDAAMVDAYVAEVAARDPKTPTFDYLVFESSHYDYHYPPQFERFTPTAELGFAFQAAPGSAGAGVNDPYKARAPAMRNRYQNSILWVDSLVQRVVDAWRARTDDVVLVVTGDHGESFWEQNSFGHGGSMVDEQTRVPFAMCMPGGAATRYRYSSHEDVFPTIFDAMGLEASRPFVAGKSLLRYASAEDLAVVGYGLAGARMDDPRLTVAGDGLKVVFMNSAPFDVLSVARDRDVDVPRPWPPELAAEAADLQVRSLSARVLHAVP